jgi:hypothetical protein
MRRWPTTREVRSEMVAAITRSHARQQYRRLFFWTLGRALLAYAFAQTYLYLYGPAPAVVPRLGMTVAALCGAGAVLSGVLALTLWLADWLERVRKQWVPRLLEAGGVQ